MVLWHVVLSNGAIMHEGMDDYAYIDAEKSPWQKLQEYIKKNDLTINSLYLSTITGKFHYLNTAGSAPNFAPFRSVKQPLEYTMRRYFARTMNSSEEELYTVAIAKYETYELQLWVNDKNPRESWSLVHEYGK